jgi:hypothetical protein
MDRIRSKHEGKERCIQGFSGKTLGKEPLGRPRRRWEVILKRILEKWNGGHGLDRSGLG